MAAATLQRLPIGTAVAFEPVRDRSTVGNVSRRGRATALTCAVTVVLGVDAVLVPYVGTAVASLVRAGPGWAGLAGLATAGALMAFALIRRRLLRTAGVRVSAASSLASIVVSNAFPRHAARRCRLLDRLQLPLDARERGGPDRGGLEPRGQRPALGCLPGRPRAGRVPAGGRCELGAAAAACRRRGAGARRMARGPEPGADRGGGRVAARDGPSAHSPVLPRPEPIAWPRWVRS